MKQGPSPVAAQQQVEGAGAAVARLGRGDHQDVMAQLRLGEPARHRGFENSRPARAEPGDAVSLTPCLAAVAETGTLMLVSGPQTPTTLNFLPDTHIVVVYAEQVVATYEDGWDLLRTHGEMPRNVNFITGPSRTGDIEQRIQLGAHGPRRLHIVLIEGAESA